MVGVKLDEKRSTSDCDGKQKGERYFRCPAGYGLYVPLDDVAVIPADKVSSQMDLGVSQFDRARRRKRISTSRKSSTSWLGSQKSRRLYAPCCVELRSRRGGLLSGSKPSGEPQVCVRVRNMMAVARCIWYSWVTLGLGRL